ncbi:MAG: SufS family cysteine desulfurase [Clostridia bacterium]|nr:SufS family cysteine desulfurase [Clostridia bacterium]
MKDYRLDFPLLSRKYRNNNLIYFDNAATSPKLQLVIDSVTDFYKQHNANIHRGPNFLTQEATDLYEEARKIVANFINANTEEIIFTSSATASLNLISRSWGESNLKMGDIVVLSRAEHHANIVPWLRLKDKIGIEIQYIDLNDDGSLSRDSMYTILAQPRVKLLSLTQTSNVLGIYYDLKEVIKMANDKGVVTIVDAAQSIAHHELNVKELGADFLVFSGHKLFAPSGVGVLYGRQKMLGQIPAFFGGGSMISSVSEQSYQVAEIPYKFEAGTPNIEGVIALGVACRYLQQLGWETINKREKGLVDYFLKKIIDYPELQLLGANSNRVSLFSFNTFKLHPHDLADLLGEEGIIVRAGHHCAEPLHRYLKVKASLRLSLAFYNTNEEIDKFFDKFRQLEEKLSC